MIDIPAQPQAHGVRIASSPGEATVSLDGTPLPRGQVTGYVLRHDILHNALPELILHTRQSDDVTFDGLARVAVGISQSPADLIGTFLAEVDPVLLDQEALNRSDYGGGPGATARAMLAVLTEWARGKDGT